ncbi:Cu(I)-responsive transcriptional regulator [Hydrogenophaga sp. OTU3427]|uniref:Cu(I)-responsive transcriptional regulator n=1 Tax=Hydrogenophaga sp. OTU3427 TaxID=3043856 RepID=UPI00313F082B
MSHRPAPVKAWPVNIGEAARRSGVSAKMLRHYEGLGLLGTVSRTDSGYRLYSQSDVHTLQFIKRARDLGFAMADIADLVGLWLDRQRSSAKVKQVAQRHLLALHERIAQLQAMERTLQHLTACCHGDERPDCPILDDLAGRA